MAALSGVGPEIACAQVVELSCERASACKLGPEDGALSQGPCVQTTEGNEDLDTTSDAWYGRGQQC